MNQYLGKNVPHIFGSEGYNYSKVVFSKGRPILASELNLLQELQELLARRSTAEMPSGWISFRDPATSRSTDMVEAFYTQSPESAIPEIALVNGWTILVSNTGTALPFVNKVDLSATPLTKGSRVDGVFLEAWRAVVSEEFESITQPASAIVNTKINSVWAVSDTIGWAVGANGTILKTDNAGVSWRSQVSPTSYDLFSVVFNGPLQGYAAGSGGVLLRTDNGGASWHKVQLPTTDDIMSVAVAGTTNVWLAGENGTIFRSVDGLSFTPSTVTRTNEGINSVYFYDSMVGWAVGNNGLLLKSQDGGITWEKLTVSVPDPNGLERAVSTSLRDVKFVNLNDGWAVGEEGLILKSNDGGLRWANTSSNVYDPTTHGYRKLNTTYNAICFRKSQPLRISLGIYNTGVFKSASYLLTPTTVSLFYTRRATNEETRVDLALAGYATNQDLVLAINSIISSGDNLRVFTASASYSESAYESHENQGSVYDSEVTDMKFSLGDKAWVAGDAGVLLSTSNSGAQWVPEDVGISFNLMGLSFSSFSKGWVVGENAAVSRFDASTTEMWMVQPTDLTTTPQKRVYFEGNVGAAVSKNLSMDSISPDVKVTTADRVQIQYRIRVVEGVDIGSYQEAGLGSPYVYSQGPNASGRAAGSFSFASMGPENGDYGLWRAKCKNTVDGYSYAIPMFLVSKRNSAAYDPNNNINGSTNEALYVVRPDDLQPGEISPDDILDLRKTVSVVDVQQILQGGIDLVLEDRIRTKMQRHPELGTQVGTTLVRKDTVNLATDIQALVSGNYSAEAVTGVTGFIGQDTGIVADPEGALPTQDQLTFPTFVNSIWHPQPEHYTARYSGTGDTGIDGTVIPGGFTGLGSDTVKFILGATGVLNGLDYPGLTYVVAGRRVDYSNRGLSMSPDVPMSVRNPDSLTTTKTAYYRSVQAGSSAQVVLEQESASAPGYKDTVEVDASLGYEASVASSMVRVRRYLQMTSSTGVVRVSKEFNGYSCYALAGIRGANGTVYRVKEIRDREIPSGQTVVDASNLIIYLDEAYRIPEGSVVEVLLEVNEVPASNSVIPPEILGISGSDRGETSDSFRNPYVSIVDRAVKGVDGFYRSVLAYTTTFSGSTTVSVTTSDGSLIMGLPAMPTISGNATPYVWYTSTSLDSFAIPTANVWWSTARIDTSVPVTGFGTDTITFALLAGAGGINPSTSGSILVPALVKDVALVNNNSTSYAEVFYRSVVPQTVDSLPDTMSLEILGVSPSMFMSNICYGGGTRSLQYTSPLKQIAINGNGVGLESFYHNFFGMQTTSGIEEDQGMLTLPMHLYRGVGREIILGGPSSDHFGRTFYTTSSVPLVFKAAGVQMPTPRKVFVPMVARVTSGITSPVLRGELVLVVVSMSKNTDLINTIEVGAQAGSASVAIYRVPGMPLTRG